MTTTYLQLREVQRDISGFSLGPISIDIEPGLVYAVVGPNGSGKSTLFRMLMGLVRPDSGDVSRFDQPIAVDDLAQSSRIAFVPESLTGYESWSIDQIGELYRRSYPQFDALQLEQVRATMDTSKSFSDLSKGQQRRAMLSLALAAQPDVLLCDEPTDGLDPFARQDLLAEFSQFMENDNRSIVLATHNLEDVRRIADVVILLHNGRQIGIWNKDEVLEGWQRFLLAAAPKLPLDGEVTRTTGTGVQIVSNDAAATRAHLETLGLSVIQQQPVDMVETLRILLDEDGPRDRQTSVTSNQMK